MLSSVMVLFRYVAKVFLCLISLREHNKESQFELVVMIMD